MVTSVATIKVTTSTFQIALERPRKLYVEHSHTILTYIKQSTKRHKCTKEKKSEIMYHLISLICKKFFNINPAIPKKFSFYLYFFTIFVIFF